MKTLTTILAISLLVTGLRAQTQCEAFISITETGYTSVSQGTFFVNGQQVTDPALVNYVWTLDGGTIFYGDVVTNTFAEAGAYRICLVATGMGCESEICDSIFIDNGTSSGCNLTANVTIVNATDNNTADGSIDVTVSGGTAPYSYFWNNGQFAEDISGLSSGVYTLDIADSDNCTNSWSFVVGNATIDSLTLFGSFYAGAFYEFLTDDDCSAEVSVNTYGGTAPFTYAWSNSVTTNSFENACGDDFYSVTVTDALGETTEASVLVQYYNENLTIIDSLFVVVNDCFGNMTNAEIISYSAQGNTITVTWEFTDEFNNISTITITYDAADVISTGIYQIDIYFNCDGQKSLSGYSDQILITEDDITGITNITSQISGQLYPNPVIDELNIELYSEKSDNVTIQIYNYSGQVVYTENISLYDGANQFRISAENIVSGMYFVKISGNGNYETLRFVK